MALPAYRQSGNITRTIQVYMADPNITADGTAYPVFWDWRWGDPDAAGNPTTDGEVAWVAGTWIQENAGRRGSSLLQLDVFSRIGAPGAADGDPFGLRARAIADALENIWTGAGKKFCTEVLDFTVDPLNPTGTDEDIFCRTANGDFGEPEVRRRVGVEGEMWRITLRFRFYLAQDLAGLRDRSGIYYG